VVCVTLRPSIRAALVPALTFALGATLASGVAAVASSNGKTVKTCETSKGYVVSAAKNRCPRGSHVRTVAVRGPRGKAGTNAKVTALVGTLINSTVDISNTDVLRIASAPPGKYVVTWSTNVENNATNPGDNTADVNCSPSGGVTVGPSTNSLVVPKGVNTENGQATTTLTQTGDILVACGSVGSSTVQAIGGSLIAIPVSAVTVTP
jgi:hypothetical protein